MHVTYATRTRLSEMPLPETIVSIVAQFPFTKSAPGGTWGISLQRLLTADDSLSLLDIRILTLSVLRFSAIFCKQDKICAT